MNAVWTRVPLLCLALAALAAALAFAACGGDDDKSSATASPTTSAGTTQLAEVEDVAKKLLETDTASTSDVDFFLDHITGQGLKYFGYSSADDCRAVAADCIGDPSQVSSLAQTQISGDNATTVADTDNGQILVVLIRETGEWKLNGYALGQPLPPGVTPVEVSAVDYEFDWDKTKAVSGTTAFVLKNDGSQTHEILLASVEDDFDPQKVIDAFNAGTVDTSTLPPGVTDIAYFAASTPGQTADLVVDGGLQPGKYAFMCFLPDPEGRPHFLHGMFSQFTVQ
jgi:uncharacterized cupredoxin-like copper-binding protein